LDAAAVVADEVDEALAVAARLAERSGGRVGECEGGGGAGVLSAGLGLDVKEAVVDQGGAVGAQQGAAAAEAGTAVDRQEAAVEETGGDAQAAVGDRLPRAAHGTARPSRPAADADCTGPGQPPAGQREIVVDCRRRGDRER